MKIQTAKQLYSAQLNTLWNKRQALSGLLKAQEGGGTPSGSFDRVEIRRQISALDSQYEQAQGVMEQISAMEAAVRDGENARQQSEAAAKAAEEMGKMLEVYRRIASGAKVPAEDERRLMEYSHELYMAAKTAAMLAKQNDKEYDSLWEDEEEESAGEGPSPEEVAGETEISVPAPEAGAAEAAED